MTKNKTVDLADLDTGAASDKGAEIELLHPTSKEPLGVFITVVGKHGSVLQELLNEHKNKMIRREAEARRRGKEVTPPTAEERDEKAIEVVTACTTGWRNVVYNGQELPFSIANAKMVYTKNIWIRQQMDEAIDDLENFIKS